MKKVLIYNSKVVNNNFHLIISLWRAFSLIPDVEAKIANSHSIGLLLSTFKPEIVIAFAGEEVPIQTLQLLRQEKVKWVLWTTEDPFEIERNKFIAKYFDIVFTSDKESRDLYSHPHCYYLPLAADKDFSYYPVIENSDRLLYDLIFVGTAWPNRTEFLRELIERLRENNLRSRFILPTNPFIPPETLEGIELLQFERDFRVSVRDLACLQNYSRFALTIFRDFSGDGYVRPQTSPTNRFYETALAGTGQIVVCDRLKISDFYPTLQDSLFQCQKAQEVIDVILEAKKTPSRRNQTAHNLQNFVLEQHLYIHRVQELLKIVAH